MFNRLKFSTWAPVPLRLIVGYGFMEHGYTKLHKGPEAFSSILHALGVFGPHLMDQCSLNIATSKTVVIDRGRRY